MKKIIHHVERIKSQPHHIRKQAVLGIASVSTGLVAFIWLGTSLATGAFAIEGSNFAQSTGGSGTVETVAPGTSQLAGAAAAFEASQGEPRIQIVDTTASTSEEAEPVRDGGNQTVIPF